MVIIVTLYHLILCYDEKLKPEKKTVETITESVSNSLVPKKKDEKLHIKLRLSTENRFLSVGLGGCGKIYRGLAFKCCTCGILLHGAKPG